MKITTEPIRVAVVDDSRSIRAWLRRILQSDPRLVVVAEAASGAEARAMLRECDVDVLTLDVEMPGMSGIEFLRRLMIHRPMPVVMVSTYTEGGSEMAIKALSLGAVDCIEKPRSALALDIGEEICRRVYDAAHVHVQRRSLGQDEDIVPQARSRGRAWTGDVILLGASTGGVTALEALLTEIDGNSPPVVIAQHMPESFLHSFGNRLNSNYARSFCVAHDGLVLQPGVGVLALGKSHSTHLVKQPDGTIHCVFRPPSETAVYRPNVDDLFHSAAMARLGGAAALLTGMGKDGAQGLLALRNTNFTTYAQDEASCVVYGMPKAAMALGAAEQQLDPGDIGRSIGALNLKKSIITRELAHAI